MSTLRLTNLQHTDASDPNIVLANDRTAALADGTASAPALSFQDDLDTGLYSPGANSIALAVGGSAILTIASTGNTTLAGAITTTSLSAQSTTTNSWFQTGTVLGGANYVWAAKDTSANVWHSGLQTDGDLYIGGDLTSGNRIGLTGSTGAAFFASQNVDIESTGRLTIKRTTHSPAYGQEAFRILDRNSSNVERVSMYADGKAVFGNTSGSYVQLSQNSGVVINDGAIDLYQATSNTTATPFKVQSDVGGTKIEKVSITANGILKTNNPTYPSTVCQIQTDAKNTEAYSPTTIYNSQTIELHNSVSMGSSIIRFRSQSSNGAAGLWNIGAVPRTASTGSDFIFQSRNTSGNYNESIRLDPNGGIKFNGDTAAANNLDDYEEGTWSPTIKGWNGSYSIQHGAYIKIGRVVHVIGEVSTNASTGNSIDLFPGIQSLPFNHATDLNSSNSQRHMGTGNMVGSISFSSGTTPIAFCTFDGDGSSGFFPNHITGTGTGNFSSSFIANLTTVNFGYRFNCTYYT